MAYDPGSGRTRVLRLKENADDYRYFPDPDLVPLRISPEQIESARSSLPEFADAKRRRFEEQLELSAYDASLLTESRPLSEFFEAAVAAYGPAKPVANWILRDVLQALGEQEREIDQAQLTPEALASLIRLVDEGRTNAKSARGLVPDLVAEGGDPEALVRERGLEAVSDSGVLEAAVDEVLAAHPDNREKYQAGEKKVVNFLMGQVMKRTQGKADPGSVREILLRKLEG
jgi:aspartyl-tRNA(Asn)/glutamyl-tRNA(Gln) amidotransferase subunit B